MSDFYNDDQIDEGLKRNVAFQTANAVREAVSMATKKPQPITYEQTLRYIHDLNPEIYSKVIDLLSTKNENDKVRYYKDMAKYLRTKNGNSGEDEDNKLEISLIDTDLKPLQAIVNKSDDNKGLKLELAKLYAAREYFLPRKISEHKILEHDTFLAERPIFGKKVYENDSYQDYSISNNHVLRMRLLHPDKAEAILGADLIYEQFDLLNDRVRFVHLQYKAWDQKALYLNEPRMKGQIEKMHKFLCGSGLCLGKHGKNYTKLYRLPYCSGFLRPTSNKLNGDSKMVTTGDHVPICEVIRLSKEHVKITKENIKRKSVSHKIFEESFNENQLGSRWIPISQLDKFYEDAGLTFLSHSVRVHAQEVIIPTDEEIQEKKKK